MRILLYAALSALLGPLTTAPSEAADIFQGKRIYGRHCAQCHGVKGRSSVPGTPHFSQGQGLLMSDYDLVRVIKKGKNLMPGYATVISDADILNVIAYIRSLPR
jgi:mono/diheme cytochrome c family protein